MGKAIKPSTSPTYAFMNRGVQKKPQKVTKKTNFIDNYLRTLSSNFRPIPQKKEPCTKKRKVEEIEETSSVKCKKPKVNENLPSHEIKSLHKATSDTKFGYKLKHLESECVMRDLFYMDELKNNFEHVFYTDWLHHLCDEISLEGLDGITLDSLWMRMKRISTYPVLIEGKEELFWNLCKYITQFEYHVLQNPRGKLNIYDRNTHVCPESGIVLEAAGNFDDIYPYSMVNKAGIKGSCSTYYTREDCTLNIRDLSLEEAINTYGNRLVIVASQRMREKAIMNEISNPNLELVDNEYGLLERVGRSRELGESTQGKVSVLDMIKDSRSIFHIRKSLEKKNLLKKQFFIIRNMNTNLNKTGKLLHLPRFYRKQKSKTLLLIEEMVELLRQKPGYSLEFGKFKKYFPRSTGAHKVIKSAEFMKYVRTDIFTPYRFLYPNATAAEWKYKNKDKEKSLRIFQLIDPTVNVAFSWNAPDNDHNSDEECNDDDTGGHKMMCSEFLKEVFLVIFNKGKNGVTLQELEKMVEMDYYTIRMAIRKLQAKNVIDSLRSERGKQRHILYFARCFHSKIPRTMPVSQPMKLPDNILQKVLQPQRNAAATVFIDDSVKWFNEKKIIRNFDDITVPFECKIFATCEWESNKKFHPATDNWKSITFSRNKFVMGLVHERIYARFYELLKTRRRKSWIFAEPNEIVVSYNWSDLTMKLILLRNLILGNNISIVGLLDRNNSDTLDLQDRRDGLETPVVNSGQINCKVTHSYSKDWLLGPNPVVVYQETTPENINVTIVLSTPPKSYVFDYTTYTSFNKNLTPLSIFRTNTILELVNQSHVICDIYRLQKNMSEIETESAINKQGQGKIDKNTLHRLLLKLTNEGYIKIFKLMLSTEEKIKSLWLVAHPRIEANDSLMKAKQEQLQLRFFLGIDKKQDVIDKANKKRASFPSPFDGFEVTSSFNALKETAPKPITTYKISRQFGRLLGFQPKFVRLQLLHEILFYLIHDYSPLEKLDRNDLKDVFVHYTPAEIREIPPIYRTTIDWKMFVPPLPIHSEWRDGWARLCDVLLAMPLSLWTKLFHVSIECTELFQFMEHPIKRHYLIKDVPSEFRHVLLFKRKYLQTAVELVYKLCFTGLVQLGPQSSQIKDQLFIYFNRKATLLDTTSSGASYHKVTQKKYKELSFNLTSRKDVDEYWCQLWTISMNTPLGHRNVMDGKSVTIENPAYKTSLLEALKSKSSSEACICDDGDIPGDKQGAAGLDSSMWAHIRRNWSWSSKSSKVGVSNKGETENIRNANIACIKPVSIKYKELISQNRKVYIQNKNLNVNHIHNTIKCRVIRKPKAVQRKFVAKKVSKRKKPILDQKDKLIRKKFGNMFRCSWSKSEDKILCLLKAALDFLCTNSMKELVPTYVFRDLLHLLNSNSNNKTTAACSRRVKKLCKSDPEMKRMKENPSKLINLKVLSEYFSPIIFHMNKTTSSKCMFSSTEIIVAYIHLMFFIAKNSLMIEKILQGHTASQDYFAPKNIHIFSHILVNIAKNKSDYSNPVVEDDIKKDVIRSVLLSFLNGAKLGKNTSYQLFCICKNFPDMLIRSAVLSLKDSQAISLNKKSTVKISAFKNMPFLLSMFYSYMQKSTFSTLTVHTIYQHYLETIGETPKFANADPSKSTFIYSRLIARNEIATICPNIEYVFNIPNTGFVLNPYMQDRTFLITELASRYQQYLQQKLEEKNSVVESKKVQDSSNTESSSTHNTGKDKLEMLRGPVTRLLLSLPSFCNRSINEKFPSFLETKDMKELEDYLSIFLETFIAITLNLLSTEKDSVRLLYSVMPRLQSGKIIDSRSKELQVRLLQVGHIMREFLKKHTTPNIKECFENVNSKKNNECEKILRKWLEKSKQNCFKKTTKSKKIIPSPSNIFYSFFKLKMEDTKNKNPFKNTVDLDKLDKVPEIEEIVQEMMIPPDPSTKRTVPHISELVHLLSRDKFPKLNYDEKVSEYLKNCFIPQYPCLEAFQVDQNELKRNPLLKDLFNNEEKERFEQKIEKKFVMDHPDKAGMVSSVHRIGGRAADLRLTEEIITFVYNKGVLGASGKDLKSNFKRKVKTLDVHIIVEILIEHFIFLRTGIADITFVHSDYSSTWLVETFHLLPHENNMLELSQKDELQKFKEQIDSRIKSTKRMNVLIMPWVRIDGSMNIPLLERWLAIVLSYCLDYPNCSFSNLCEKFYLVKPVELYFLLEVLRDLNCVKILVTNATSTDIFSARREPSSCEATCLDNFENIIVQVHRLSTICMGFYLDKESIEFA